MGQDKPLAALMISLAALLFTGLGLITVSMIVGTEALVGTFYYFVSLGILILGILLVLIGTFGSIRFIVKIRASMDKIFQEGYKMAENPVYESSRTTRVIRQKMPVSITDNQIPKPKSKPKPTTATVTPPKPTASPSKPKTKEPSSDVAATMSLDAALQSIVDRYNTEKVKKSFNGWNETLVMRFPDIEKSYMYVVSGSEGLEFKEGDDTEAAVQVEMDSSLFQKLISKQINAIKAYSSGKMNVSGQMKNMLKLRKLMF